MILQAVGECKIRRLSSTMKDSIYAAGGKVDSFTVNHLLPTNIYLFDFQPKDPHFWKGQLPLH